jgi:hypothetical protein
MACTFGEVAQLGERRVRNAEVVGSIPIFSTTPKPRLDLVSNRGFGVLPLGTFGKMRAESAKVSAARPSRREPGTLVRLNRHA